MILQWLLLGLLLLRCTSANTEKAIFRAPQTATILDVDLPVVQPTALSRVGRLVYTVDFPASIDGKADLWTEQWFRLDGLGQGWMYEIRVCWPAIMPTMFDLHVFNATRFRNETSLGTETLKIQARAGQMFLRTKLRPDFVTHREDLRTSLSRVKFELILDPLLFGCLPRSILGVVGIITMTALLGLRVVAPQVVTLIEDVVRGKRQKIVRIKTH